MSSLSCGTPLSILDLPTEILFVIFADEALSPQDLFSLAILCRIFHFIALTLYFSRNGLDPSTRSIQIPMRSNRRDLLAALRVALFETSLDRINFIFPHPIASSTSVFPLLEHLQRVEGFLSRRSSVKSVSLELNHVDCSKFSVGSDEALRAWSRAVGDLLNCILTTECTTLTVTNGCQFADAYQLVEALPLTRRASWFGRLLYQLKAPRRAISAQRPPEFQRVSQQGLEYVEIAVPRDCSRSSRLTCIHIHSTILLLPPGLRWTLDVLRSCPISQLTFSKVMVKPLVWSVILPLIASAAPSLTSVVFLDILFMPECEIMAFVPQLAGLVDLTIHAGRGSGDGFYIFLSQSQPPYLPRLTHLRTSPNTMVFLLAREGLLPALEKATVLVNPVFVSCDVAALAQLLTTIIDSLAGHPCHPMLALALIPVSPPVHQDEMEPDVRASLDCVQGLEFTISPNLVDKFIGNVVLWVAVFRRVKSVAIRVEPQADVGTLPQRLASSIAGTEFLRAIEVNGMEHPLTGDRLSMNSVDRQTGRSEFKYSDQAGSLLRQDGYEPNTKLSFFKAAHPQKKVVALGDGPEMGFLLAPGGTSHEQTVKKICHKVVVILQDFGVHSTLFGLMVCRAGLAFTQFMEITGVGGAVPQRFVFPSPIIDESESSSLSVVKPSPANATATIVSGLQTSLASLNKVTLFSSNDTKAAVAAANSSITSALAAAQKAVAANCQTTVSGAVSVVSETSKATTSATEPVAASTVAAGAKAFAAVAASTNGAPGTLAPSGLLAGVVLLMCAACFYDVFAHLPALVSMDHGSGM
ncbi:hypothetical protein DFH06DRAFT_1145041 [Mycena polygramma]|nr:hypothetical protein DFH06DRAFT_1145041 [Mycena polygramma]